MNAPAEYLVCRHWLSHPQEPVAKIARHLDLFYSVVKGAKERIEAQHVAAPGLDPGPLVQHALRLSRRPRFASRHFFMPNPENWFQAYRGRYLESGERVAANQDRINLIPEHYLVYVPADDLGQAIRAAIENFGKFAPPKRANLEVRVQDKWLRSSQSDERIVERGQRLLDYEENPNIRMAQSLTHHA